MNHSRYFGLHFDFHAQNTFEIGQNTTPEDIAWYIEEAHPDFVQCDCKGHPGNSCYPTRVGKAADKLMADNLKVWVDTVHSYNLPIYVHYSGIMDSEYIKAHPEAAVVNEDGTVNTSCTSVFSSYVDDLMIPQLKELIDEYGIDGVWVDGDNWAVYRDYSENAKPYLTEGMTYSQHNRVMRDGFEKFIAHYVDELHHHAPQFCIGSNWLYTSQVPEKPKAAVDYISGDFDPANSAHRIRFETRCIAHQGKPWDLMSWSFGTEYNSYGSVSKSAEQMMQEAASVITQGGGFQMYITQNSNGSAVRTRKDTFRRVADFMHPRRFLYGKKPLAQVALFHSAESRYEETAADPCVYNPPGRCTSLKGLLHAVLDSGYTADIILEHQTELLSNYEAVLVPEWKHLPEASVQALLKYAANGGTLITVGATVCELFSKAVGIELGAVLPTGRTLINDNDDCMSVKGPVIDLKQGEAGLYRGNDHYQSEWIPLYRTESVGSGRLIFFGCDFGACYDFRKSYIGADIFGNFLSKFITPWLSLNVDGIDVALQQDGEDVLLNLVNMRQSRHSMEYIVFERVPSIDNVIITLQKPFTKAETVLGEPCEVECDEQGHIRKLFLKRLDIHSVIRLS